MPNIVGRGLWGNPLNVPAAPQPITSLLGSSSGGAVADVSEVWASNAAGVPQLVWVRSAGAPSGVAATYLSGNGQVSLTVALPGPVARADTIEVFRNDSTLVGTITVTDPTVLSYTLIDNQPQPNAVFINTGLQPTARAAATEDEVPDATGRANALLNFAAGSALYADGSAYDGLGWQPGQPNTTYAPATWRARTRLGSSASGLVASNAVQVALPVSGLSTAVQVDASVVLTWTHNASGRPYVYNVWRQGTLLGPLPSTATTWTDVAPLRGQRNQYTIVSLLSGPNPILNGVANTEAASTARAPTDVVITYEPKGPGRLFSTVTLTWNPPAGGAYESYEVIWNVDGVDQAVEDRPLAVRNSLRTVPAGSHFYQARVRAASEGGYSGYVQRAIGPVTG